MAVNYGELMDADAPQNPSAAEPAAANKYGALMDADDDVAATSLQESMFVASTKKPDEHAKALELSKKTNVPASLIDQDTMADVSEAATKNAVDYRSMVSNNPRLTNFLSKPDNASATHDDVPAMKDFDDSITTFSTVKSIGMALARGVNQIGSGLAKTPAFAYDLWAQAGKSEDPNYEGLFGIQIPMKAPDSLYQNPVTKFFDSNIEFYREKDLEQVAILEAVGNKNYKAAALKAATNLAETVPLTASLLMGNIMGVGAEALAAAGAISGAEKKNQLNSLAATDAPGSEAARDQGTAVLNAALTGTFEAATEAIPMGVFNEYANSIFKQFGKQATKAVMFDTLKTLAGSSFSEGAEEVINSIAEDLTDWATDINPNFNLKQSLIKAGEAGAIGAASGGLMTGPAATVAGWQRMMTERTTKDSVDHYSNVGEQLDNLKASKRGPEIKREMVKEMVAGTDSEHVHVNAGDFAKYFQGQNIHPVEMAGELGVQKEYENAIENDGDIKVPTAVWAEKLHGTEHYDGLKNDIKFNESDLSHNEFKRVEKIMKQTEEDNQKKADDEAADPEIASQFKDQLLATNRFSDQEARLAADHHARFLKGISRSSGIPIQDLVKRYPLRIEDGSAMINNTDPNAMILEQAKVIHAEFGKKPRAEGGLYEPSADIVNQVSVEDVHKLLSGDFDENSKQMKIRARIDDLKFYLNNAEDLTAEQQQKMSAELSELNAKDKVALELAAETAAREKKGTSYLGKKTLEAMSDHGKEMLSGYTSRVAHSSDEGHKEIRAAIKKAQDPKAGPYVHTPEVKAIGWTPNYLAKPTGVIGEPKIQEPNSKTGSPDPFMWAEDKYKATKELLISHSLEWDGPLTINTSSDLIAKADYIAALAAQQGPVTVNLYMLTRNDDLNRKIFPGSPSNLRLENAAKVLRDAGITVNKIYPTAESIQAIKDDKYIERSTGLFGKEAQADMLNKAIGLRVLNQDKATINDEQVHEHLQKQVDDELSVPNAVELYNKLPKAEGGKFISTDEAREISALYRSSPAAYLRYSHTAAREVAWRAFVERMAIPRKTNSESVMLLAGGTGAGKSTVAKNQILKPQYDSAHAVYDSTLSDYKDAKQRIDYALKTERGVNITFVYTHIDNAIPRMIKRYFEDGHRYVPASAVASSHIKSIETMIKLYDAFNGNDRFTFKIIDNNTTDPEELTIDELRALVYTEGVKEIEDKISKGIEDVIKDAEKANKRIREEARGELQKREATDAGRRDRGQESDGREIPTGERSNSEREAGMVERDQELDGPRGQISFGADNSFKIDFFKTADLSTAIHELAHFHFEVLGHLASDAKSNQTIKDDYSKILKWLGVESKDQVTSEHHEKFARGVEAYLMEGKAPTSELQATFARFKAWLLHIYKDIKNLKVELNQEIRDVFDRLVAADDQIKAAQAQQGQEPLFGRDNAAKFMGQNADAYFEAVEAAKAEAEGRVTKKLLDDYNRARSEIYHEKRKEVRARVEAEVSQRQVYKTIDTLQKGELDDGTKLKLDKKDVIDSWGVKAFDVLKNIKGKYMYAREGGVHPDIAARLFGYENGDTMMQDILNAKEKDAVIERLTDRSMVNLFPDSYLDGSLPQEAIEAVHNNKRAQILRMELEELAKNHLPVLKDIIRRVTKRVPSEKEVKEMAAKMVGDKAVGEMKPHVYALAERKSAKLAGEALAKGDIQLAFDHKYKELLNHELYRAAIEARDDIEKSLKKFKKIARSDEDVAKSRDTDLVNAARSILASFGIGKSGKTPASYLEKIKREDPDTYNSVMVLVESATENVGDYKGISYNDFVAMADAVNAIYDLAKSSREIMIDGKKMDRDEALGHLSNRLSEIITNPTKPGYYEAVTDEEKRGMKISGALASMKRTEHWADTVDGGRNGPFTKYIWNPVAEATTKYRLEKKAVIEKYEKIIKEIAPRITRTKVHSPELNYTFKDKAEVLMALLHSGNNSNLDKLLRGREWGSVNEDGTLERSRWDAFIARMQKEGVLGKAEYDFAQKMWDLMESMKSDAQKAHKEMYGYYFNEITANAIETPFGTYKGGYVPAKVDVFTNEDAEIRNEREEFEKNNNSYQFPTTGRGFSKERVQQYAAPLSLELSLLAGHIDGVMRFTHIEPRVKEVSRLVMNKQFRTQLAQLDPSIAKDMLVPWLQRSAQQKVVLPSETGIGRLLDSGARYMRQTVAMQIMIGNVVNTLQQFTGLSVALTKIRPKHMRQALATYITDIKGTTAVMLEKSDFMKSTQGSNIYETQSAIHEIIVNPTAIQKARDFAKKHTYILQTMTQNIVNTITWTGAYNQAVANGLSEKEAVRESDSAVRLTQGTNAPEDISRFETGTATQRMFTQFAGYFNMLANVTTGEMTKTVREVGYKKGAGRLFYVYMTALMIPAVLSQVLVTAAAGKGLDEDDDDSYLDDLLSIFFGSQIRTMTAAVPYAGGAINSLIGGFTANRFDDRMNIAPAITFIENMASTPAEVYKAVDEDGELKKKTVKDALMLMGIMSGLPIGPVGKPVGYLMDVDSGMAEPSGPIDFTRGLITGRPGQQ